MTLDGAAVALLLLDTNACIGVMRGRAPELADLLRRSDVGAVATSSVVRAELLVGARKSARPSVERAKVLALLADLGSLPFDDDCAEHYAEVRAFLERQGQRIGDIYLLIAATARRHGATIVTRNEGEFRRVPGLVVQGW